MKLFTVGPVEMFPETLNIAGKQLPYFRTQDFSDMMLEADSLLHRPLLLHHMQKQYT